MGTSPPPAGHCGYPMSRLLIVLALALLGAGAAAADAPHANDAVQRGRYLVMIGGCNDCHTAGFAPSAGKVPESQWLLGDRLGFSGPWGTTYPANLRLRLASMDIATWKAYAHGLTTRPPMPYWALNAMSETDLEALYAYVRSLGPAGEPAPRALSPGLAANGPVVQFPAAPAIP
jgi:mono/diheme cytochrome c family protein